MHLTSYKVKSLGLVDPFVNIKRKIEQFLSNLEKKKKLSTRRISLKHCNYLNESYCMKMLSSKVLDIEKSLIYGKMNNYLNILNLFSFMMCKYRDRSSSFESS